MKNNGSDSKFLPKKNFLFDSLLPLSEKQQNVLKTLKDAHSCRVGTISVQWEFTPDAPSLQSVLTQFLIRKKNEI